MNNFARALKLESANLLKSKFLLFMYFVMPLFVCGFMYSTIYRGVIHNIPIGVVNLDNSLESSSLIFDINSSSVLEVKQQYTSILDAENDLNMGNIYALVIIPSNFEFDIKRGLSPNITVYYNAQLVFVGKNIKSALTLVLKNKNTSLNFIKKLIDSRNTTLAFANSIDFIPKIMSLYNSNSDFSQFLLTAVLPCAWQLFMIICMISLVSMRSNIVGTYVNLSAKFLINTLVFFIWWLVIIYVFNMLSYPINGNFYILCLNALVTILAYNSVGLFIYAILGSSVRSISVAAFYSAPSLAFLGITYPVNSMEVFPTFWSSILPISNYMKAYFSQSHYGLDISYTLEVISLNTPFILIGILGSIIYDKKYNRNSI